MTRQERIGLHTNQKRIQASKSIPSIKEITEGKPIFRETHKGLYQYVKFRGEVYSTLLTKHTKSLQEEINDTVNNITVNTMTVTDPIDVADGGTGLITITDGAVMLGSGTSAITPLAVTTDGSILIGDGSTDPTTYDAFSSSTGTLKVSAGGTGAASLTSNAVLTGNGTSAITAEGNLSFNGSTLAVTGALSNTTAADLSTASGITTIGSSNALTVSAAGVLTVNNTTDSDAYTAGSVIIDGGVGVAGIIWTNSDIVVGDDLIVTDDVSLNSDGSIFRMGDGGDFSITHDGGTGATVTSSGALIVDSTASTLTLDGHSGVTLQTGTVSADITLDSGDDIILSADGDVITMDDGTTTRFTFSVDSTPELLMKGSDPVLIVQDTSTGASSANARVRLAESDGLGAVDQYWDIHHSGLNLLFTRSDGTGNVVIRSSYITDHAVTSKPATNGRHFATGDADYQQNYSWIGLYDQQAGTGEHDADFGDWS